ncbi:MAG: exosome complex protein Rrp42 [Methanobacteriota archaeon]|nr:MAG: exosome complex protein Rrp42 [Euryarchaeota archaeon]
MSELLREHIARLAASGKRSDGRGFDEPRKLVVQKNYIKNAEGSARVQLGNTNALVGVKIDVGEPSPDTPNQGVLSTSAELIPLASPTFESGPPSPTAIEIARVVDRGIRESKTVNVEKLCITPKEKVWIMFIDIHALDYDGNLFDAASYGALSALSCAKVPASKIGKEDYPLPLEHWPISVTSAKIGGNVVVDPNLDEERIADARITVTTDENGDIRAMQKGLRGSFNLDEIRAAIRTSQKVGKGLRGIIQRD